MRLIDADGLKKDLSENYTFYGFRQLLNDFYEALDSAPSIDIVYCGECKYEPICIHSVQHTTHEPTSVTIGYKSVEWCSYGEREGE